MQGSGFPKFSLVAKPLLIHIHGLICLWASFTCLIYIPMQSCSRADECIDSLANGLGWVGRWITNTTQRFTSAIKGSIGSEKIKGLNVSETLVPWAQIRIFNTGSGDGSVEKSICHINLMAWVSIPRIHEQAGWGKTPSQIPVYFYRKMDHSTWRLSRSSQGQLACFTHWPGDPVSSKAERKGLASDLHIRPVKHPVCAHTHTSTHLVYTYT